MSNKPQNVALEIAVATDSQGRYMGMMPKAAFSDGGSAKADKENAPFTTPSKTKSSVKARTRHAYWGSDDKLPNTILDKIELAITYNSKVEK